MSSMKLTIDDIWRGMRPEASSIFDYNQYDDDNQCGDDGINEIND